MVCNKPCAHLTHCAQLNALNEYLSPPDILIIRSYSGSEAEGENWALLTQQYYLPFTLVYNIPAEQKPHTSLIEKIAGNTNRAYLCSAMQCQNPFEDTDELQTYLRNNSYRVLE